MVWNVGRKQSRIQGDVWGTIQAAFDCGTLLARGAIGTLSSQSCSFTEMEKKRMKRRRR